MIFLYALLFDAAFACGFALAALFVSACLRRMVMLLFKDR